MLIAARAKKLASSLLIVQLSQTAPSEVVGTGRSRFDIVVAGARWHGHAHSLMLDSEFPFHLIAKDGLAEYFVPRIALKHDFVHHLV